MTIDDIHAIYDDAYRSYQIKPVSGWSAEKAERYALRKVVEALRDEIIQRENDGRIGRPYEVIRTINEILASDGEEPTVGQRLIKAAKEAAAIAKDGPAADYLREKETRTASTSVDMDFEFRALDADPIRDAVARARGRTLAVDDIPTLNKIAAAMQTPAAAPDVCDVCRGTGKVYVRTTHDFTDAPEAQDCEECTPTIAPAVCEWVPISEMDRITYYSSPHGVTNDLNHWRRNGLCHVCLKAISFKKAAR
jgi:hypothetical protein